MADDKQQCVNDPIKVDNAKTRNRLLLLIAGVVGLSTVGYLFTNFFVAASNGESVNASSVTESLAPLLELIKIMIGS